MRSALLLVPRLLAIGSVGLLPGACGPRDAPAAPTAAAPSRSRGAQPRGHADPGGAPGRARIAPRAPTRLPRRSPLIRWLPTPGQVHLWAGPAEPVPLRGRVAQIGTLRWPARGLPRIPAEIVLPDGSWIRGQCAATDVEIPMARGTLLRAVAADPDPVGVALASLRGQPILRRANQVLVRIRIRQGCGGTVRLWIDRRALEAKTTRRPLPAAFKRPPRSGLDISCVTRALTLQAHPGGRPLLALPLCSVLGYSLHRLGVLRVKRARWARVRYRPGPHSPLVLLGVLPDRVLRRAVRKSCACQCIQKSPPQPAGAPPRPARITRDLPLYRHPDAQTSPVGVLRKGFRMEPPERLAGARAAWTRIYLNGQAFYLPHVVGSITSARAPR